MNSPDEILLVPDARMYCILLQYDGNAHYILEDRYTGKKALKFKTVDRLLNRGGNIPIIVLK